MTELCDIAFKYGTDKCPQTKHHFTEFYYEMFRDRRKEIKKVVEIGIGCLAPRFIKGASLYMWRDFFPKAKIYGVDIRSDLMIHGEKRIETFCYDQTVKSDLKELIMIIGGDIDIFIDDGAHEPETQAFTCRTVMPLLDDPFYFIEDAAYLDPAKQLPEYSYKSLIRSGRKYKDDRLILIRKRNE